MACSHCRSRGWYPQLSLVSPFSATISWAGQSYDMSRIDIDLAGVLSLVEIPSRQKEIVTKRMYKVTQAQFWIFFCREADVSIIEVFTCSEFSNNQPSRRNAEMKINKDSSRLYNSQVFLDTGTAWCLTAQASMWIKCRFSLATPCLQIWWQTTLELG